MGNEEKKRGEKPAETAKIKNVLYETRRDEMRNAKCEHETKKHSPKCSV